MAAGDEAAFLTSLILAFAQPFFNKNSSRTSGNKLQVIYIDNSYSMSAKKGARGVLDIVKEAARKQVAEEAQPGSRFILLTNDKPFSYRPEPADKVYAEIIATDESANAKTVNQVLASVRKACLRSDQQQQKAGADVSTPITSKAPSRRSRIRL